MARTFILKMMIQCFQTIVMETETGNRIYSVVCRTSACNGTAAWRY